MFNEVYVNSESMSTKFYKERQETKTIGWRKTEMTRGGGGDTKADKKRRDYARAQIVESREKKERERGKEKRRRETKKGTQQGKILRKTKGETR